jgi:hypothetical protein
MFRLQVRHSFYSRATLNKCCRVKRTIRLGETSNLKTHTFGRDNGPKPCPQLARIEQQLGNVAGPSSASTVADGQQTLVQAMTAKFSPEILNRLLTVATVMGNHPWTFSEDPILRIAFKYAHPKAKLISDTTNAKYGRELYVNLRTIARQELKVSASDYPNCRWLTSPSATVRTYPLSNAG